MNPCYNLVDFGRDYKHVGKIYPFRDRPDIAVRVLWFPVPLDTPSVPYPNPFVLRNWDRLEELEQTVLGTDQEYREAYTGLIPVNAPGRICGTADQWMNGLLYSDYLAGGLPCDCPMEIYMSDVSSVRNDDGSLGVMPNTDDVEVHIDTTHTNTWTSVQNFTPMNAAQVAAVFKGFSGQTAPYVEVLRSSGGLAFTVQPDPAETIVSVNLFNAAGIDVFNVASNGILHLNSAAGGPTLTLDVHFGFAAITSPLELVINSPSIGAAGPVTMSRATSGFVPLFDPVELTLVKNALTGPTVFRVRDAASIGGSEVFQVNANQPSTNDGLVVVNYAGALGTEALSVQPVTGGYGLVVHDDPLVAQVKPLFGCNVTGVGLAFGVNAQGDVFTQRDQAVGLAGLIIRRLPIFNQAGTLIGYIPIYNVL